MNFTYCTGYRCGMKSKCLRNIRHLALMDKKVDTRGKSYIESTICVRHRHRNLLPVEVYGSDDEKAKHRDS